MKKNQDARAKLYRSDDFRTELADGLGLAGLSGYVFFCLNSLMAEGRLPQAADDNSAALAMDGCLMVTAIGCLQTRLNPLLNSIDRLYAMKLGYAVEKHDGVERIVADDGRLDTSPFGSGLAEVFKEYWAAPSGAFLKGFCHTSVYISKRDVEGTVLYGVLERLSVKRSQVYSSRKCVGVRAW